METCSCGWESKAGYSLAGRTGGAFRLKARRGIAAVPARRTDRSDVRNLWKEWDFMDKLIIIFAGTPGKARKRVR